MYDLGFRIASLRVLSSLPSLTHSANVLGISKATLSRWVRRLYPLKWKQPSIVTTDLLISSIRALLSNKLYFSLASLSNDLKDIHGISISKQLLHTILRSRFNFSYKRTKKRGVNKNTPIQQYDDFLRVYERSFKQNKLVAIDECGFDHRCIPTYAYSPKGVPAIACYKPSNDRQRYTMNMAIHCRDGSYKYELSPSSCKSENFRTFLENLPYKKGTVLVLDDASIHKTKSVILTASRKGYHLLFIPPYTPEANPIELVFGIVKNSYYKARYCNGFSSVPLSVHQSVALLTQESVKNTFKHVPTAIGQLKGIQI